MGTTNKVYVNRVFNCSVHELYNWLVTPDLLMQWFGPKNVSVGAVQMDLRIGGQFSIELLRLDATNFFIEGEFIEIDNPKLLSYSSKYKGLNPSPPEGIVTFKLEKISENETKLYLMQELESIPHDMDTRTAAWEHMFNRLYTLL